MSSYDINIRQYFKSSGFQVSSLFIKWYCLPYLPSPIIRCVRVKSLQSCPSLCDPMDHSLPGSSVHGILQARTLEWVAISSSRGSSQGLNPCFLCLLHWQVSSLPLVPQRSLYYNWIPNVYNTKHMRTVRTALGWCGDEHIVNLPQSPALGVWLNGSCYYYLQNEKKY